MLGRCELGEFLKLPQYNDERKKELFRVWRYLDKLVCSHVLIEAFLYTSLCSRSKAKRAPGSQ